MARPPSPMSRRVVEPCNELAVRVVGEVQTQSVRRREPPHLVMLLRRTVHGIALPLRDQPQIKHHPARNIRSVSHLHVWRSAHHSNDTNLFPEFTHERISRSFAGLKMTPREIPTAGVPRLVGTPSRKEQAPRARKGPNSDVMRHDIETAMPTVPPGTPGRDATSSMPSCPLSGCFLATTGAQRSSPPA